MRRFMLGLVLFAAGAYISAAICRTAALALLQLNHSALVGNPWVLALQAVHGNIPLLIGLLLAVVGFLLMLWQVLTRRH